MLEPISPTKWLTVMLIFCGFGSLVYGFNVSLGFSYPIRAQQHAPMPEQCRADLAVWYSPDMENEFYKAETVRVTDGTPDRTETNRVLLPEIEARMHEMAECRNIDPAHSERYGSAFDFYEIVAGTRYYNFVLRHNLFEQLLSEDAEGKR